MFYACKANTNLAVMKILEKEGSGIDAVSPGEIYTSLMTGSTLQESFTLETMLQMKNLNMLLILELG